MHTLAPFGGMRMAFALAILSCPGPAIAEGCNVADSGDPISLRRVTPNSLAVISNAQIMGTIAGPLPR
jgi:hypothetical protein